jgi:hypothetical protein
MGDNTSIAWMTITYFVLAGALMVLVILFPAIELLDVVSPGSALWVIGALALLGASAGFLAFRRPQGKLAALGGLLPLAVILWVTPVYSQVSGGALTRFE